jgi:sec-independent protein translocase protein TatC
MASTGEMTFWDHLEDLRKCIFRVLGVFASAVVVLFFFKNFLFDSLILAPSKSDFFLYQMLGTDFSMTLVNIEVAAQFMIHIRITLICAFIVTFPVIVYELWRFVAPALYENEKRLVKGAFAFASLLFYLGVAVGYALVFPLMLNFFSGYQVSPEIANTFSLTSYISLFTSLVMTFGIVFEFPTVVAVLSSIGLLTRESLSSYRKHAVCAVLILAAVITPSGDPFSLLVVSVPLYLLYEFSILICRRGTQNIEEE